MLETNQIVGVLLTDDFGAPPPVDFSEISDKFIPILTMLEGLDENYRQGRAIVAGQYLHLFMLAVDIHFAGRGIAQQFVTAFSRDYLLAYSATSSLKKSRAV